MILVLRSLAFQLVFYLWTAVLCLSVLPAFPFLSGGAMRAVARFWERVTLALLRLTVGLSYEVRGRERLPPGPVLLAAGLLLLLAAPLQAGPIFLPGQLDGDKFVPAPGVPCHCYAIRFSTANVTAEKDAARVEVEEVIEGPEKAVAAVCLIPLPDGAKGDGIRVTWGKPGAEPKILGDATFLSAAKA